LKNEEQGYCLDRTPKNSFSLSECDNFPLEQQWFRFMLTKYEGFYISSGDGCLAVVSNSNWFINKKPEVTLQTFDGRSSSLNQQWVFHQETRQLQNVATKLCLVAYLLSPKNSSTSLSKFKIGIETCHEKPKNLQKWSFVRVRDDNNETICRSG